MAFHEAEQYILPRKQVKGNLLAKAGIEQARPAHKGNQGEGCLRTLLERSQELVHGGPLVEAGQLSVVRFMAVVNQVKLHQTGLDLSRGFKGIVSGFDGDLREVCAFRDPRRGVGSAACAQYQGHRQDEQSYKELFLFHDLISFLLHANDWWLIKLCLH